VTLEPPANVNEPLVLVELSDTVIVVLLLATAVDVTEILVACTILPISLAFT
jgi:hypothetical protein